MVVSSLLSVGGTLLTPELLSLSGADTVTDNIIGQYS